MFTSGELFDPHLVGLQIMCPAVSHYGDGPSSVQVIQRELAFLRTDMNAGFFSCFDYRHKGFREHVMAGDHLCWCMEFKQEKK